MKQILVFLLFLVLTSCTTSIYEVTIVDSGKNDTITLKVESRERVMYLGDDTDFYVQFKDIGTKESSVPTYSVKSINFTGTTVGTEKLIYRSNNPTQIIKIKHYSNDE